MKLDGFTRAVVTFLAALFLVLTGLMVWPAKEGLDSPDWLIVVTASFSFFLALVAALGVFPDRISREGMSFTDIERVEGETNVTEMLKYVEASERAEFQKALLQLLRQLKVSDSRRDLVDSLVGNTISSVDLPDILRSLDPDVHATYSIKDGSRGRPVLVDFYLPGSKVVVETVSYYNETIAARTRKRLERLCKSGSVSAIVLVAKEDVAQRYKELRSSVDDSKVELVVDGDDLQDSLERILKPLAN